MIVGHSPPYPDLLVYEDLMALLGESCNERHGQASVRLNIVFVANEGSRHLRPPRREEVIGS